MGHRLQAVIAIEPVLRELADRVAEVRLVPLGQQLSLVPMTDALFDAVAAAGAPRPEAFWKLPAGFDRHVSAERSAR